LSYFKRVAIEDLNNRVAGIDASTHSLQFINYEHHETHNGSHYYIQNYIDVPVNDVYDIQITTPNTTKWLHFDYTINVESETTFLIYEGVTINVAGTTLTPINNNRNSVNVSGATFAGIENTSVANANADTAVAAATLLSQGKIGLGGSGGTKDRENELVMKQNTNYTIRLIADAAGFISFYLNWYEHTDKA